MINNVQPSNRISYMTEIPGQELEFTLIDLLRVLSELSLTGSHLDSVFPHLGIAPRSNHCSIYTHDLLFGAVSAEHYRDILKRSSIWVRNINQNELLDRFF